MNIVVCTDSFKGSLTSAQAGNLMIKGLRRVFPDAEYRLIPMADGGEGTASALTQALGGRMETARVHGPLGKEVEADVGFLPDGSAVMDMASASGLTLVASNELDPMRADTFGTGELIRYALDMHCSRIYLGIGGSATNDGGSGMARALGARFLDEKGAELPPGGGALKNLSRVDCAGLDQRLRETSIEVMCDVDNPLCGPEGASFVYGPQKGAAPDMVHALDAALDHYQRVLARQTGLDLAGKPGAGAAGGLGYGLMIFAKARLCPGVDTLLKLSRFDELMAQCDLVVTGEGRIDGQSAHGKTPCGVARAAARHSVPVIAIGGSLGEGAEALYGLGVGGLESCVRQVMPLDQALARVDELLPQAAERAGRMLLTGRKMHF